ncbi:MAG: hypothetical protein QGI75_07495 [Phycisphaerales bacterium]|jgi:hypothetical protein|nr:hypothetical protein [Phycisphaerales bacterium]
MTNRNNLTWWLFTGGTIGMLFIAALVGAMPIEHETSQPGSVGLRVQGLAVADVATLAGGHFIIADETMTLELGDGPDPAWRHLDAGARLVRGPAFAVADVQDDGPPITVLMRADSPIAAAWYTAADRVLRRAADGMLELVLIEGGEDGGVTCYGLSAPTAHGAVTAMLATGGGTL